MSEIILPQLPPSCKPLQFASLDSLAFAGGVPVLRATLKQEFSDFRVAEQLAYQFSGEGEHLCICVEKTNHSTVDVVKRLCRLCAVSQAAIGYAGMKDRRAITKQWFSLHLAEDQETGLAEFESESLRIVARHRNARKIKIGSHKSNHFRIRLRNCQGPQAEFETRLNRIKAEGVPNYFGKQRFGRELSNLTQVQSLMESVAGGAGTEATATRVLPGQKFKRGMLFSAARSYLFNQLLSLRLEQGSWNQYLPGDVLNLNGSNRSFVLKNESEWDQLLQRRLESFDIHITGLLPGLTDAKDNYASSGKTADIEEAVCKQFTLLTEGLRYFGVQASRRALRFCPIDLRWQWTESELDESSEGACDLLLDFSLVKGAYATSLLRELCDAIEPEQQQNSNNDRNQAAIDQQVATRGFSLE